MHESRGPTVLTFHDTKLDVVEHIPGQIWLRAKQIEAALGYVPDKSSKLGCRIRSIYTRHRSAFTDSMSALVQIQYSVGRHATRIFNLRGAHLLGTFARTSRSAEFRHWIAVLLESEPPAAEAAVSAVQVTTKTRPIAWAETAEELRAQRDALRKLVAARAFKEDPSLRKALHYSAIEGLTNSERARLCGWEGTKRYGQALRRLTALGLIGTTKPARSTP